MNLRHIKQENCPHCGAKVISETRAEQDHTNGQSFETRTFACHHEIRWVPNFASRKGLFSMRRKWKSSKNFILKAAKLHQSKEQ